MNKSPLTTFLPIILALAAGVGIGFLLKGGAETHADGPPPRRSIDKLAHAVSVILVKVDQGQSPLIAEKLAMQAYEALRAGKPFEEVARARSQDPTAIDGGFIGFAPAWEDNAFSGAIQTLTPGSFSVPLRTKSGFQILKRHSFEEGRELEQRYRIPAHGIFVRWAGLQGADSSMTREKAFAEAKRIREALGSGKMTLDEAAELHTHPRERKPDAWIAMIADRPQSRLTYQALAKVPTGGIVGPVETERGYGVLVRGRYFRSLVRHIVVQHVNSVDRNLKISRTPEEAAKLAQRALDEALADRSKWNQIVERYSDEAETRLVGGSMGVVDPGIVPAGFESVIYDIPPGEIYDKVLETPMGFHVIWRVN